jgi:hypothetical protein
MNFSSLSNQCLFGQNGDVHFIFTILNKGQSWQIIQHFTRWASDSDWQNPLEHLKSKHVALARFQNAGVHP